MLKGEFWSLPVASVKCGGRREPAASAFALDTGAGGIKPELACIRVHLVILCRRGNAEAALSSARNHG
jgi:hypothetical protein